MGLCDTGFKGHDGSGALDRIVPADHLEHARDIDLIERLLLGPAGFEIVVAVRQADTGLAGRDHVTGRGLLIDRDARPEERDANAALGLTHIDGHGVMGVRGADGGEVWLKRPGVERLEPCLIHIGAVGVGDLLFIGAGDQVGACQKSVDHHLDPVVRQFPKQVERAVGGAVRRDLQPVQSRTIGMAHEAVARADRGVAAVQVKAPGSVTRSLDALVAEHGRTVGGSLEQFEDGAALVDAGVAVIRASDLGGGHGRREQQGTKRRADEQFFHGNFLDFASLSDRVIADPTPRVSPVA